MLYPYELGLLSDADREAMEIHQLDCDYCYKKIKQFKQTVDLIQHDPQVKEKVKRLSEDLSYTDVDQEEDKVSEKIVSIKSWKTYIPLSAVASIVLFLLIFKAWHLEFSPTHEAVAVENRLAVMYFENITDKQDPRRLGEITTNLIITDLAESDFVSVVSSQRLYDILRLLGREEVKNIGRDVALEVARKAEARWMLLGSIIEKEGRITIASQLIEVSAGDYIAGQRISGNESEDIFSLIDRLTVEIKRDLSLPSEALLEPDRRVAEVTTSSADAYRCFVEGIDYYYKYYFYEATEKFKKAIQLDSTFAMAYCYLARTDNPEYIEKAVQYSDRAGQLDRYFILIYNSILSKKRPMAFRLLHEMIKKFPDEKYAYMLLAQQEWYSDRLDSAVYYYDMALQIDPMFKNACAEMAQVYNRKGDLENAVRVVDKYIELAPDEAYPYQLRADMYASHGMVDKAIGSFKKAVEIKDDYFKSWQQLGYMYVFNRQYDLAAECFRKITTSPDKEFSITGRYCLALIPIYQGKFREAMDILDKAIELNRRDPVRGVEGEILSMKALISDFMDNPERALEEIQRGVTSLLKDFPERKLAFLETHVRMLARNGKFDEARQVAENIKAELVAGDFGLHQYYFSMGAIAYYEGNMNAAIESLSQIFNLSEQCQCTNVNYLLGMAYLKSGRIADAVAQFENQLKVFNIRGLIWGGWYVKLHYQLGLAYEQSNWNVRAAEQYRIFLDIWKDADPGIDEIADARERLKKLESMP